MGSKIADLDLMRFCNPEDIRPVAQQPHQFDGGLLATDASIAIVVDDHHAQEQPSQDADERAHEVLRIVKSMLAEASGAVWRPLPAFAIPDRDRECPTCAGGGVLTKCLECDGWGEIECECRRAVTECAECGGVGRFPASEGQYCETCDGHGALPPPTEERAIQIGGAYFDPLYLQLIQNLPGLECTTQPQADDPALLYRFAGGYGALMPCKVQPREAA